MEMDVASSFLDYSKSFLQRGKLAESSSRLADISANVSDLQDERPASERLYGKNLEQTLERIAHLRRQRSRFFNDSLFADPAWDILLALALAEIQFRRVCVTRLCDAAQVPPTTGLRWITHLEAIGAIVRRPDPLDGRRKYLELSDEASKSMRAYLESVESVATLN
jgi:DNA-binding MarR family transcriptional regulator